MKRLISKLLRENLLKEFMGERMVDLKHYFNMSDEEKIASLPYEYPFLYDDFLYDGVIEFEPPKEVYIDSDGYEQEEEMDSYSALEWVSQNNKPLFNRFGQWLFKKINDYDLNVDDSDYPAWSFFLKPQIIKNQWLIHFTNDAFSIGKEGFKYGVDEMTKLGLTTHLSKFDKDYGGYNFSYTLNDYLKYAKNRGEFKYGEEAVIFRASGLRLYHTSDEEYQTIFYGNTATNIIPIVDMYGDYVIHGKDHILYKNEDFNAVVNWLINNYTQYRKQL